MVNYNNHIKGQHLHQLGAFVGSPACLTALFSIAAGDNTVFIVRQRFSVSPH